LRNTSYDVFALFHFGDVLREVGDDAGRAGEREARIKRVAQVGGITGFERMAQRGFDAPDLLFVGVGTTDDRWLVCASMDLFRESGAAQRQRRRDAANPDGTADTEHEHSGMHRADRAARL
jgi:hypothetical protein